jgi:large subunit ribosomal protein L18e
MAKRTGPTNPFLRSAIESMRKKGKESAKIWDEVARKLNKPTRSRVEVNVAEIARHAKEGETVVVPGVVLSSGNINKKVSVAAWRFTNSAEKKIREAGGKTLSIEELREQNPKGANVRIMV